MRTKETAKRSKSKIRPGLSTKASQAVHASSTGGVGRRSALARNEARRASGTATPGKELAEDECGKKMPGFSKCGSRSCVRRETFASDKRRCAGSCKCVLHVQCGKTLHDATKQRFAPHCGNRDCSLPTFISERVKSPDTPAGALTSGQPLTTSPDFFPEESAVLRFYLEGMNFTTCIPQTTLAGRVSPVGGTDADFWLHCTRRDTFVE